MKPPLPACIETESQLDELLSTPTEAAVAALARIDGDILLLGAGGKMGLTLAQMVRRALGNDGVTRRVVAVSRFQNQERERALQSRGIDTIRGDLLDEAFVEQLPDAGVVFAMTGYKFGTADNPSMTWATNVLMPSLICRRFAASRIAAFSTGNVYPLVDRDSEGCTERDACGPVGEYAMSALGRERIYQYYSLRNATPVVLLRLNYAVEMRYGVLVDIAQRVWAGEPVDVSMGWVNVIWQGDACALSIAALSSLASPCGVLNIAGPERLNVREVAQAFARSFERPAIFCGRESHLALLNNGTEAHRRYGRPRVTADQMIQWIADWIRNGRPTLAKPTHFEVTRGGF